jgi:hypothetical protein
MSDSRKQSLAILARVAEFLETLPDVQLDDLQAGTARLTLIPAGSETPLVPKARGQAASRAAKVVVPSAHAGEIAEQLRTVESREAAAALLKPLRKDPELKEVAAALNITILASLTKDKYAAAIVEATVGNRLDSQAIRGNASLPY